MKITTYRFAGAALCIIWMAGLLVDAHAQQRIEMADVGFLVTLPADWGGLTVWNLEEDEPEMVFHHVQANETGRYVAMRWEACPTEAKQQAWTQGETKKTQLPETDRLIGLSETSPIQFGTRPGFLLEMNREAVTLRAYDFYWVESERCYNAQIGAPAERFEDSGTEFQAILDSIAPLE